MKIILACVVTCALAAPVQAQQLPTASERHLADIGSWATAVTVNVLDARASWTAPDRTHAFVMQGVRIGVTYSAAFLAKTIFHRERPCAPDCGIDNPDSSFYSAHTASAFQTLGGPRLAFALPLTISTGGLRVAAGKHWPTDVIAGAIAGALTSRIR